MDTGLLRNNTIYYDGFEGQGEIIFELESDPSFNIHLWEGYLDDILQSPDLSGKGWNGLTRDYHQLEGAFATGAKSVTVPPLEYLTDLLQYRGVKFDTPETVEVLDLMIAFFQHAIDVGSEVIIKEE